MLRFGSYALAALLVSTSNVLAEGPINPFQVGQWQGGTYTDANGAFSNCTAWAAYQSGITFFITVNSSGVWTLGFVHPSWDLMGYGNFGAHPGDEEVALGTAVCAILTSLELGARLATEAPVRAEVKTASEVALAR